MDNKNNKVSEKWKEISHKITETFIAADITCGYLIRDNGLIPIMDELPCDLEVQFYKDVIKEELIKTLKQLYMIYDMFKNSDFTKVDAEQKLSAFTLTESEKDNIKKIEELYEKIKRGLFYNFTLNTDEFNRFEELLYLIKEEDENFAFACLFIATNKEYKNDRIDLLIRTWQTTLKELHFFIEEINKDAREAFSELGKITKQEDIKTNSKSLRNIYKCLHFDMSQIINRINMLVKINKAILSREAINK